MTQRVTIDINNDLLGLAQRYVSRKGSSLSSFIETLLYENVPAEDQSDATERSARGVVISPFVASLGVDMGLSADVDEKTIYRQHLASKHS